MASNLTININSPMNPCSFKKTKVDFETIRLVFKDLHGAQITFRFKDFKDFTLVKE